jgi:8-oxo-dGTP diphosphatase
MEFRVAVDVVIFTVRADAPVGAALEVLLVQRGIAPFRGRWAIPGGFVLPKESLADAALRELREETGLRDVYLEQLYTFGAPGRDPRGRVVSVAYFALIAADQRALAAGSDAAAARFWPMSELPSLAFDHASILAYALERLRNKLEYTTVGFQLLPAKFTLSELQHVYEAILGRALDKRNFRRKLALLEILVPLNEYRASGRRPAQLYRFSQRQFDKLKDRGILFPF